MNSNCIVVKLNQDQIKKLKKDLQEQGFALSSGPHLMYRAQKKGISICVYESGKATIQGKEKQEWIEFYFEPELLQDFSITRSIIDYTPRIGCDEAGKGDFFGPLCICALHANESGIKSLEKLGIKDSKKISDSKIFILAKEIKKVTRYSLISIYPKKYNELYQKFLNLNDLMAWGHASAIEAVYKDTGCKTIIVDQFASPSLIEKRIEKKALDLDITQMPKAESDIVVAASSILAREAFLAGLKKLSQDFDFPFPKGASQSVIIAGRKFASSHPTESFSEVAKLHFKTYGELLKELGKK